MKNISKALLASAIALTASTAFAEGDSVTLTVTGAVTPSACTPTLGGNFEFGAIDKANLPVNQTGTHYVVPYKELTFTVSCAAPTSFVLAPTDHKADSRDANSGFYTFGLGWTAGGSKIGYYVLGLLDAAAGGNPVKVYRATDSSATAWEESEGMDGPQGRYSRFGDSPSTYSSYQQVTATLAAFPYVRSDLDFSEEIKLDGSATIEVKYL